MKPSPSSPFSVKPSRLEPSSSGRAPARLRLHAASLALILALCPSVPPAAAQETRAPADGAEARETAPQGAAPADAARPEEDAAGASQTEASGDDGAQEEDVNEDEMADVLNSMQQLQQTFTLKRTIDGEVTQTEKRTITYTDDAPIRASEAGLSPREQMMARFDNEVLTRTEAFEEAKLDFVVADVNRDGLMDADEFAGLVASWREKGDLADGSGADAPGDGAKDAEAAARLKFAFMAGASSVLTQKDYIREYLVDFDAMDANGDQFLKSEELADFRAANRGDMMGAEGRRSVSDVTPPSEQ